MKVNRRISRPVARSVVQLLGERQRLVEELMVVINRQLDQGGPVEVVVGALIQIVAMLISSLKDPEDRALVMAPLNNLPQVVAHYVGERQRHGF